MRKMEGVLQINTFFGELLLVLSHRKGVEDECRKYKLTKYGGDLYVQCNCFKK